MVHFMLSKNMLNALRQVGISKPVAFALSKLMTDFFGRYAFWGNSALVTGETVTA